MSLPRRPAGPALARRGATQSWPTTKKDDPYGAGAIAEELRPFYQLERVARQPRRDRLGTHTLAHATALRVIAEHGSDRDRQAVVENLKTWFEEFRES